MMPKKRIFIIITILSLGISLIPTSTYALPEKCGDAGSCATNVKTASIEWEYGESEHKVDTTTSSTGSASVSYGAGSELQNKKSGSWKFNVHLDASGNISGVTASISGYNNGLLYNGTEHLGTDSKSPVDGQCPQGYKRTSKSFSGTEVVTCEKVNLLEYGSYYATLEDGNIRIKIDGGRIVDSDGGKGGNDRNTIFAEELTCDIKGGKGNTLTAFNSSVSDCASKLDKWVGHKKTAAGAVDNSKTYEFGKITTLDTEGKDNVLNEEGKSEGEAAADGTSASDDASTDVESEPCYDNAGPMGWILCPVVSLFSGFASSIYEDIATKYLQVDAGSIFEQGGATYNAWSSFRDVANILFVIAFIVVIISQLTGYGIDNYGIKRMLPRIIVAAILINLSYFICQLAVDLANIIGMGISGLLSPNTLGISVGSDPSSGTGSYIVSFLVVGAGIGVGAYAIITNLAAIMAFLGPTGVIMCVLAVISAVIAILFLWLILVARQAIIIILIVLSPLALVCYLLPNTENLAKKYLKAAQGTLLLYPICQLVVSGGQLAGVILTNVSGDGSFALAAMVVQVVPFFLIPTLLKNSMNAVGNIGAKISGVGKTVRGGYDKLRTSDTAKDYFADKMSQNATRKAGLIRGMKKKGGISAMMGRSMERSLGRNIKRTSDNLGSDVSLGAAAGQLDLMRNDDWQASRLAEVKKKNRQDAVSTYQSTYEDADTDALKAELVSQANIGGEESINRANAVANVLVGRGEHNAISDLFRKDDDPNNRIMSDETRAAIAGNLLDGSASRQANSSVVLSEIAKKNSQGRTEVASSLSDVASSLSASDLPKTKKKDLQYLDQHMSDDDRKIMQSQIQTAESSDRISESIDSEHKEQFDNIMRREPGSRTPIAKQDSSTSTSGETLEVRNTDQSTSTPAPTPAPRQTTSSTAGRKAPTPDWVE